MANLNRPSNEQLHRPQIENFFAVPAEVCSPLQRTSDPNWVLVEEGLTLAREHEVESLLALGNGHVGTRASLEEGSELSAPATFVAGVFEHPNVPGAGPELAVLPDWAGIKVWVNECPLKMQEGRVLEHRRILDFKQGVLWREWRHRDVDGRITRFNSLRLTSLANRKLLLQWILLTAENYSPVLCLESSMKLGPDIQPLLPPDWRPATSPELPNLIPLVLHDGDGRLKAALCIASQLLARCTKDCKRRVEIKSDSVVEKICLHADAGTQCELYRFVAVDKAGNSEKPLEDAQEQLENTSPRSLWTAAAAHASEWRQRWEAADVQIEGDCRLQQALRFAMYHLISAANPEDNRVSIGARALTGEAYKGHVFWDTEIYMLPFYTYTHPASARSLLGYRHYTLAAARNKARAAGYRGAMYAWESADTGEDVTPLAIITPAGEVLQVRNGELEVHITADVAYAVWQYWKATGDDEFFLHYGAEIMLESTRFWASRGTLEADGIYHIRHVIGPDEYHEDVDDNAYTNLLAAWNLRRGAETAALLNQRWRDRSLELAASLLLTEEEVALWPKLADAMATGFDPQTLLFEQFSGYFKKEQIDLKAYEPRSAAMDVILSHKRLQQTDIVKQPDVIMAIYLLWEDFPADVRAANFHYYEPKTAHGSSLSPSIHALIAARLGDMETAQRYLKQSAEIDLGNTMGNAAGGVHAAALGGLWQAAIFGFAGAQADTDGLKLAPNLLPDWRRISFPVRWRDCTFRISIEPETTRVVVEGEKPLKLRLVDGPEILAEPRQEYVSRREKQSWSAWRLLKEQ